MKTKNSSFGKAFLSKKRFALVQIAIVLCSVFLVAIPAIAADTQKASANTITTASEDDYVLGVYGNANEDDTIDMGDVVYTKLAIFGKKPKTELCDAKYDGRINVLDVIQTKLIILGKEKEITVIDMRDRIVTVKKPIERLIVTHRSQLDMLRSLKGEKDRIVGIERQILKGEYEIYFAEYQDKASIGSGNAPDVETILTLRPDAVLLMASAWGSATVDAVEEVLESADIPVIRVYGFGFGVSYAKNVEMLGYILGKKDEAEEYIDWYESHTNLIKERVENIPEEDKPKVYYEPSRYTTNDEETTHITKTGGKDIFEGKAGVVDPEAVATLNPDIIVVIGKANLCMGKDDITEFKETRDEIMSRPELQKVTAVETGKVYVLGKCITVRGGMRGGRGFILDAYFAKWFNPTYFEDFDPKAIHQEYLTRFQGLDFDLDKHGVYVYHPEEHPNGN